MMDTVLKEREGLESVFGKERKNLVEGNQGRKSSFREGGGEGKKLEGGEPWKKKERRITV